MKFLVKIKCIKKSKKCTSTKKLQEDGILQNQVLVYVFFKILGTFIPLLQLRNSSCLYFCKPMIHVKI